MTKKKIPELTPDDKQLWLDYIKDINQTSVNHVKTDTDNIKSVFIERMDNYVLRNRIDLHGYTINEAYEMILSFIDLNFKAGRHEIRIITGKGKPEYPETLNKLVPRWLKERPLSNFVSSADFALSNPGELIVKLKKHK